MAVSITCLLITSPARHELAKHLTHAWLSDCQDVVTITSKKERFLHYVILSKHRRQVISLLMYIQYKNLQTL